MEKAECLLMKTSCNFRNASCSLN